ncbi:MAG: hypothetical protein M4D85_04825 [Actinomycetota bacterium]|nr:hypothetical protein [Actinomycetota bacterium]MDQ3707967.1 hypothetical protein [Actinomycetota bacterium]
MRDLEDPEVVTGPPDHPEPDGQARAGEADRYGAAGTHSTLTRETARI